MLILLMFKYSTSECIAQINGSNCSSPFELTDGLSHTNTWTSETQTSRYYWYRFVVTEANFSIKINIADISQNQMSNITIGRIGCTVFGGFYPCESICNLISYGDETPTDSMALFSTNHTMFTPFVEYWNGDTEVFTIESGTMNLSEIEFPAIFYLCLDMISPSLSGDFSFTSVFSFDTENISTEWPDSETSNPYGLCANYYSLSPGLDQTASFATEQNGLSEIWFSAISSGPSGLSLNLHNEITETENPCSLSEASIEVYGPIEVCDDPCSLIENLVLSPAATVPLDLNSGQFTYQPMGLSQGQYLFKLIYDAYCEPCNLNLEYDLSNALADWPAENEFTSDCDDCLPSTFLVPNKAYVFSIWVKQDASGSDPFEPWDQTYTEPTVSLAFNAGATIIGPYDPSDADPALGVYAGPIIEGWQLMEITFMTPSTITDMNVELSAPDGPCFFDDIRLFPKDGSMKSYVYDPQNLRFVAELDERHFATLYEYDEEGRLMRIKKETERGIMTIQESKTSTVKR
jgi:hypothetical protein